jgi:hypothetical protein
MRDPDGYLIEVGQTIMTTGPLDLYGRSAPVGFPALITLHQELAGIIAIVLCRLDYYASIDPRQGRLRR